VVVIWFAPKIFFIDKKIKKKEQAILLIPTFFSFLIGADSDGLRVNMVLPIKISYEKSLQVKISRALQIFSTPLKTISNTNFQW